MDCRELSDSLSAYIDGELEPSEALRVTNHLGLCSKCRQELVELQNTINILHELPELTPSADFHLRVMNKIRGLPKKQPWYFIESWQWFPLGAVAAAILLFVISLNVISPFNTFPTITESSKVADSMLAPNEQPAEILSEPEAFSNNIFNEESEEKEEGENNKYHYTMEKTYQESTNKKKEDTPNTYEDSALQETTNMQQNSIATTGADDEPTSIPVHSSASDSDLKNRATTYRVREEDQFASASIIGPDNYSTGFEYNVFIYSDDIDRASQEIEQLVYSLGGTMLVTDLAYLEAAVPMARLEEAFAAFNSQGIAEVRQFVSESVNQVINLLTKKQDELLFRIKQIERELPRTFSQAQLDELETELNRYYGDLKITQLRLKTIANGNAIVKIYFE